jgi:hypothetical protein
MAVRLGQERFLRLAFFVPLFIGFRLSPGILRLALLFFPLLVVALLVLVARLRRPGFAAGLTIRVPARYRYSLYFSFFRWYK